MKRPNLLLIGLVLVTLLSGVSTTLAYPPAVPLRQTSEVEPNDDFDTANGLSIPGSLSGNIARSTSQADVDYLSFATQIGRRYRARLTVLPATSVKLQLQMIMYNYERGFLDSSTPSSSYTELSWTAAYTMHYIRIEALSPNTTTLQTANYQLNIDEYAATPTPTNTPQPGADPYEPNDTIGTAYIFPVVVSASAPRANFVPSDTDQDWFAFYVKTGRVYRAYTANLTGVDTFLEILDQNGALVGSDNDGGGGFASRFEWQAAYDGYYYLKVTNKVNTSRSTDTYDLTVMEISPAATATPTLAPGVNPSSDRCDRAGLGNTFDSACIIALGQAETFNFVPPFGGVDNDFFKVWIKRGMHYECATSGLDPGVDPNMIFYSAPSSNAGIGGNDDVRPGDLNSYLTYYATYDGWLYVLVGYGTRTPSNIYASNYTLRCDIRLPEQPTATPLPSATSSFLPTSTPWPVDTPVPSPTPYVGLTVRPLTTPTPPPAVTPAPRFIPIRLLVYYDGNDDRQPGAGEGVAGVSTQVYEVATNQLLAQGFTDDQGNWESSVSSAGLVRLSVPFFGFSQLISGEGASVYLRVPPQPRAEGTP